MMWMSDGWTEKGINLKKHGIFYLFIKISHAVDCVARSATGHEVPYKVWLASGQKGRMREEKINICLQLYK